MLAILPVLLALLLPAPALGGDVGLVLVLAIDQLRSDRLSTELPGGLGRLAREGRVYTDAALDHAMSETCPGHAVMLTGRQPARTGIPSNTFIDVESAERVYCVSDPSPDAAVLGAEADADGRSPRNMWGTGLGEWMKEADPESRVFSVAGKDRAAITLGGHGADGVYWYRRGEPPSFTTSRYYRESLPDWALAWNGRNPPSDGFLAGLPELWEHAASTPAGRIDDFEGESTRYLRTSGHPVRDDEMEKLGEQLYFSPFLDAATLDFALRLAEEERLGEGDAPDLLTVGLSGTDLIGHLYGPFSVESSDALARLDADLGRFLDALEAQVGKGRVLVALSSDHGVLPLPEWLDAQDRNGCPAPDARTRLTWLGLRLFWRLHRSHSPLLSIPRQWIIIAGTQLAVNRRLAKERGVEVADVVETARRYFEALPAVRKAWTAQDIAEGDDELARLYRNSFVPSRSGDLVIQLEEDCLIALEDVGTTHGTPYLYDRAVPLLFHGPGIAPARVPGRAATVDMAPTLARRLGITPPGDLDGRDLLAAAPAPDPSPAPPQSSETPSTSR